MVLTASACEHPSSPAFVSCHHSATPSQRALHPCTHRRAGSVATCASVASVSAQPGTGPSKCPCMQECWCAYGCSACGCVLSGPLYTGLCGAPGCFPGCEGTLKRQCFCVVPPAQGLFPNSSLGPLFSQANFQLHCVAITMVIIKSYLNTKTLLYLMVRKKSICSGEAQVIPARHSLA